MAKGVQVNAGNIHRRRAVDTKYLLNVKSAFGETCGEDGTRPLYRETTRVLLLISNSDSMAEKLFGP
jgi:hypothetical protein